MNRPCLAKDQPRPDRRQVIGVDVETYAGVAWLHRHIGGDTTQSFRQHYRGATMEDAHWLVGALVDGHGCSQEIVTDLGKADIQMFH